MNEPSLEELLTIQLNTLMRIYDVLLISFATDHPEAAQRLVDEHSKFNHIGPAPYQVDDLDLDE